MGNEKCPASLVLQGFEMVESVTQLRSGYYLYSIDIKYLKKHLFYGPI